MTSQFQSTAAISIAEPTTDITFDKFNRSEESNDNHHSEVQVSGDMSIDKVNKFDETAPNSQDSDVHSDEDIFTPTFLKKVEDIENKANKKNLNLMKIV